MKANSKEGTGDMTEEQNSKIVWLNRAFYAEKKIQSLEAVKEKNKALADKFGTEFSNENIDDLIQELRRYRTEIFNAISTLNNDELEAIMNLRYLTYMTMQQISESLCYDRKTIQRKHKLALDKIEI